MNKDYWTKIEASYKRAGFDLVESNVDHHVYRNKFSVHHVFLLNDLEGAEETINKLRAQIEEHYVRGDYMSDNQEDVYWNYYSIFLIQTDDSEQLRLLREKVETDLQMYRKYVLTVNDIEELPPSLTVTQRGTIKKEKLWENEWKRKIGQDLYDRIVDSPKSGIEQLLRDYVDAKTNQNS